MPKLLPIDNSIVIDAAPRLLQFEGAFCTPFEFEGAAFKGAFYSRDGKLIEESQRKRGPTEPVFPADPSVLRCDHGLHRVRGRTLYVGHWIARHYGHFITEGLSSLWASFEDFDHIYAHPFLWKDSTPHFARIAMQAAGIDYGRVSIISQPTVFDDITISERLWHMNVSVNAYYRNIIGKIKKYNSSYSGVKKVYLSRSKVLRRAIENEDEIEALFSLAGFEVIHPQDLSFFEQVNLFAGAEIIAGLAGSALHNSLFCSPGVMVISVGDRRAPITRNQKVCDALVGARTIHITFQGDDQSYDIGYLAREILSCLDIWSSQIRK